MAKSYKLKGDNYIDSRNIATVNVSNPTTQNLNDYITEGRYYFYGAPTNIPAGVNGFLVVLVSSNGAVKQIWYRHGTANTNDYETYVRTFTNGWSSWKRLIVDTDIYYTPGDTYTVTESHSVAYSGYVTGSSQDIRFTIPVPKSLKNISQITVTTLILNIRHVGGGYIGGSSAHDFKSNVGSIVNSNNNLISITLHNNNGWGVTNNIPVSVQPANMTLTFS